MSKTRRINHIFLLMIIALLEYIVFSTHMSGVIVFFACPVVCAVFYALKNKKQTAIYMIFAMLCSLMSYSFVFDLKVIDNLLNYLFAFLQIHLCALVLAYCLKSDNFSFKETLIALTGANLLITIADIAIIRYYHKIDIIDVVNSSIMQITQSSAAMIKSTGVMSGASQQQIIDMFNMARQALVMLIPAVLIIINIVISFVTYEITSIIFKSYIKNRANNQKFRLVSVGNSLSVATLLLLILSTLSGSSYFESVVLNFVLVAAFLYMAGGFAIICFYIYKKIKNEAIAMLVSLIVLVFAVVSSSLITSINGLSILFFVGLFDANFDFRKIRKKKKLF